jgi:hypothetical protein
MRPYPCVVWAVAVLCGEWCCPGVRRTDRGYRCPRDPGRSRLPYKGSAVTKQMRFILEKLAKALKADGTAMDDVARSPSRFHLCHHRLRLG